MDNLLKVKLIIAGCTILMCLLWVVICMAIVVYFKLKNGDVVF